jgi:hypothetical protein
MTRRGGSEARTTREVLISERATATPSTSVPPNSTGLPPRGLLPRIALLPKVGPPGAVVAVNGSGFPPNAAVTLGWQPGIGRAMVTTNAAGTFSGKFVLVFPKDRLGNRLMLAQTFGATATFLVVPPPPAPGSQSVAVQLLFRR